MERLDISQLVDAISNADGITTQLYLENWCGDSKLNKELKTISRLLTKAHEIAREVEDKLAYD